MCLAVLPITVSLDIVQATWKSDGIWRLADLLEFCCLHSATFWQICNWRCGNFYVVLSEVSDILYKHIDHRSAVYCVQSCVVFISSM